MSAAPRPTGLVVSPVSTARVSDQIAERLTAAMRDGTLKPGDRLPTEAELARDFQVGRTSIREALQKLRALGLVESRKGLGAFVTEPAAPSDPLADFARWTASDPAAIEQLVEARVALETLAAALAAIRATDHEVDELERLHVAHANAADDTAALVSTDQAFHLAIIRAARNRFVQRAYEVLIAELTDFRRKTLALPWAGERSVRGHAAIVRAVRGHEPAIARDAMADHLWVLYTEIEESAAAEGRPLSLPLLPRDAIS